ncbi:hypothetical protein NE237_021272 [Protea cynaroides]|uniref:ATP citrate synthase n=1 Tax=Protea cynaroides TaxID=273540 RepID=A0A9Q0HC47_9MAGN|nr:hypothetical protein NE237_021272 [Protea cynaroides]
MFHISSGSYRVLQIDYAYHSLILGDPRLSTCNSIVRGGMANGFVLEPWRAPYLNPAADNAFMLIGCSPQSPLFQGFPGKHLPCRNVSGMGCEEYYDCPAWDRSAVLRRTSPPQCCSVSFEAIRAINLTKLQCEGYSSTYNLAPLRVSGPSGWSYGIRVMYTLPSGDAFCRACESTGGVCGYHTASLAELCICGGRNSTSNCDSVSSASVPVLSLINAVSGFLTSMTIWMATINMNFGWSFLPVSDPKVVATLLHFLTKVQMARKKIREYDSKRILKEHFKRLSGADLAIKSAQITESTDLNQLLEKEPWLLTEKLVVKPDMLFGKRGKSGLVALKLDFAEVATFVKERLGKEVEMGGCKGPITTFIVEPFVPHNEEFYLNILSERLGCSISFSECGGVEIEENWDKVKTIFVPTGTSFTSETCAPLIATLSLEVKAKIEEFIKVVFALFMDLDFTFLEMNPFALVDGKPYPLDMRGELDDTAAFKNFKKWGNIEFPMPFGRVMSPTESFIHGLDEKTSASLKFTVLNPAGRIWTMVAGGGASVIYADTVGDLGFASELGNYAEYSGAPNEEEVLQYARVVIDCVTANPDGRKRALVIGGGIANFTDVAATFNGIIRALREKVAKLKAAQIYIYVRRGGPNYQKGLERMRLLGEEIGIPIEVYGPEATMTGICKQAIEYITAAA